MSNGFLAPFAYNGNGTPQVNLISTDSTTISWEFYDKNRTVTLSVYRFIDPSGHTGAPTQIANGLPAKDQYKWRPADSLSIDSHDIGSYKLALSFADDDEATGSGPFIIHGPDYTSTTSGTSSSTSSALQGASPTSSATTTPQSSAFSSQSGSNGSNGSSNNTGVIVGSTIGAALFLVIMMAAFFLTWHKRKARAAELQEQRKTLESHTSSVMLDEKALPPSPSERTASKGTYHHEMSAELAPKELGSEVIHEMDAGKVSELPV